MAADQRMCPDTGGACGFASDCGGLGYCKRARRSWETEIAGLEPHELPEVGPLAAFSAPIKE